MTLGDIEDDFKQKGKKKVSKHDKRNKKSKGAKGQHGNDAPVAGEINTRLLSALLTVS